MTIPTFLETLEFNKSIIYMNNEKGIPTAYRFSHIVRTNTTLKFLFVSAEDMQLKDLNRIIYFGNTYARLNPKTLQLEDRIEKFDDNWGSFAKLIDEWYIRYYNNKTNQNLGVCCYLDNGNFEHTHFAFERWQWFGNKADKRFMYYGWKYGVNLTEKGFNKVDIDDNTCFMYQIKKGLPYYMTETDCKLANRAVAYTFEKREEDIEKEFKIKQITMTIENLKAEIKDLEDNLNDIL